MDIIITLTYVALAIAAFKIFRLKINAKSVTTAALGGAYLMGWMYISMAFYHPYTPYGRIYFETTPIAINVKGTVSEVYVDDDRHLKQGEPLFKIDPTSFESAVKSIQAKLKLAKLRLVEQQKLDAQHAGTRFDLEQRSATVDELTAELEKAQFNLKNTLVTAPADGRLVQNRIKVGTMAGVFKVSSLLTFMPDDAPWFIAAFRPNGLSNIKEGYEAEVFFTTLPGKTFKARVKKVWNEIAEGQLLPGATMKSVTPMHEVPPGRIPVQIEIIDDISGYNIPRGSNFGVTVYSEHLTMLKELRRIYFGMFSWQNIMNFEEI